jgi:hypothetical protein
MSQGINSLAVLAVVLAVLAVQLTPTNTNLATNQSRYCQWILHSIEHRRKWHFLRRT